MPTRNNRRRLKQLPTPAPLSDERVPPAAVAPTATAAKIPESGRLRLVATDPLFDEELEMALIGAACMDAYAADVVRLLPAEAFAVPSCRAVARMIQFHDDPDMPRFAFIEPLQLARLVAEGPDAGLFRRPDEPVIATVGKFLATCMNEAPTTAGAPQWAKRLTRLAGLRELRRRCDDLSLVLNKCPDYDAAREAATEIGVLGATL